MGDRANIAIEQGDGSRVWIYAHWKGEDMPLLLQDALRRRERWNDVQYLARIVFQAVLRGDNGTAGFGLSTKMGDNEKPILVVNCDTQTVAIEADESRPGMNGRYPCIGRVLSFESFANIRNISWDELATA